MTLRRKTNQFVPHADKLSADELLAVANHGAAGLAAFRAGVLDMGELALSVARFRIKGKAIKPHARTDAIGRALLAIVADAAGTRDATKLRVLADLLENARDGDAARGYRLAHGGAAQGMTLDEIATNLGRSSPDSRTLRRIFKGQHRKRKPGSVKGSKRKPARRASR